MHRRTPASRKKNASVAPVGATPAVGGNGAPAPITVPEPAHAPKARSDGGSRVLCVQQQYATVLACMGENDVPAPAFALSWEGPIAGSESVIGGSDFVAVSPGGFERLGQFRTFRVPGTDLPFQPPRYAALGVLHEILGDDAFTRKDLPPVAAFSPAELKRARAALAPGGDAVADSSVMRLFDAVASLTGLRQDSHFEGQAAMDLEFALEQDDSEVAYPIRLLDAVKRGLQAGHYGPVCPVHKSCQAFHASPLRMVADWTPMIQAVVEDVTRGVSVWEISAKFHNALAACVATAARVFGYQRVVLTGACFHNRYLLERTVRLLHAEGFSAYWNQRAMPLGTFAKLPKTGGPRQRPGR